VPLSQYTSKGHIITSLHAFLASCPAQTVTSQQRQVSSDKSERSQRQSEAAVVADSCSLGITIERLPVLPNVSVCLATNMEAYSHAQHCRNNKLTCHAAKYMTRDLSLVEGYHDKNCATCRWLLGLVQIRLDDISAADAVALGLCVMPALTHLTLESNASAIGVTGAAGLVTLTTLQELVLPTQALGDQGLQVCRELNGGRDGVGVTMLPAQGVKNGDVWELWSCAG